MRRTPAVSSSTSQFGQNQWLVDEMYQKFKQDPSSVDASWHEFLADYTPEATESANSQAPVASSAPSAAAAPKAAAAQTPAPKAVVATAPPKPAAAPAAAPAPAAKTVRAPQTTPAPVSNAPATTAPKAAAAGPENKVLRGPAAAIAKNMSASLTIPTATSVRAIPAKLMIDNRLVINNHLARTRGGKISFTHLLGYAIVQAIKTFPNLNRHFAEIDGKPNSVTPAHTNLGLAIDLQGKDGNRSLAVAAIKETEDMSFGQFHAAYEDVVRRAREGKLGNDDFSGVTISLTNPGTIGTVHSVPRLMPGQGAIIGAGAMEYPAEFQGMSDERIADIGVGKLMTLTSTYDHRIIQGAESGDFLRTIHNLLISDEFYDEIFHGLGVPYEPIRWRKDISARGVDKSARVLEMIAAYRNRGHLMADTDPLRLVKDKFRSHPDLDVTEHGLTLWDLDRTFDVGGFHGQERMKLRDVLSILRDAYCRHVGVEYTHILET
ncbi:2-oxo acid dehydrogenase subunit E2, partial [Nocardia sp. NPDC060220]|uniref:2-oxo acid dehydrogenase subunit E2 n=1 Tax=Nocardia sp. NPDC060220 TaxID=3347076 RepID=UPI003661B93C